MNIYEFIRDNLLSFTGLSEKEIDIYLKRQRYPEFKKEWKFWSPDSDANIRLF